MPDLDAEPFAELDRRVARGKLVLMTATFAMLVFFLLSMLNFALAGGRMGLRDSMLWDETIRWPFIPLPAVLVIAAGTAAAVGIFMAVPHFRHDTADDLVLMGGISCIIFGFLPLMFAGAYTSTSGLQTGFDAYPEQGLGWHWISGVVQIPGLVALAIRGTMLYRAYRRSQQESDLPAA